MATLDEMVQQHNAAKAKLTKVCNATVIIGAGTFGFNLALLIVYPSVIHATCTLITGVIPVAVYRLKNMD
jgi:hypothetical protein